MQALPRGPGSVVLSTLRYLRAPYWGACAGEHPGEAGLLTQILTRERPASADELADTEDSYVWRKHLCIPIETDGFYRWLKWPAEANPSRL